MSTSRPHFMDPKDPLPIPQGARDVDMKDELEFATFAEQDSEMDIDHAQVAEPMEGIAVGVASIEGLGEISMTSTASREVASVEDSQMDTSVFLECINAIRPAGYSARLKRTVDTAFEPTERAVKSRLMDDIYGEIEYTYPREDTLPAEPESRPRPHPSHRNSGIHSCNQRGGQYVAFIGTGTRDICHWQACTYEDKKWCRRVMKSLCLRGRVRQCPFRVMHEGKHIVDNADAPVSRPALLDVESNPLIAKRVPSVPIFDINRIATFATLVKLSTGDVNMDVPVAPIEFNLHLPQRYNLLAKFEEKDLYPDLLQPVDEKKAAKRETKAAQVVKAKKNNAVKQKIGLCVGKKGARRRTGSSRSTTKSLSVSQLSCRGSKNLWFPFLPLVGLRIFPCYLFLFAFITSRYISRVIYPMRQR
ncbi:hypothetical protein CPB83DRAFT_407837 [Crepidotus variabilis]|uniref:Uncharacterized protein n=1 Tax=Crepidotus variabilis TaxID=179855 RepID=A0A9P6JVA3_9AGAR|nr:hypothetical protein CPB83DRAFT_407837 [Crepidotus variabilis]